MKIIVLGDSHGGFEIVDQLLKNYADAQIQWFDRGNFDQLLEWQVSDYTVESLAELGVETVGQTEMTRVLADDHQVLVVDKITGEKRHESYDKLILAPGAKSFVPDVPGHDLAGIFTLRTRLDAVKLRQRAKEGGIKSAVVVGGGYIGVNAAQLLSSIGAQVTLIDNNDRILSTYLDEEMGTQIQDELGSAGVSFALNDRATGFVGDEDGKVTQVTTASGAIFDADIVLVGVGNRADTAWLAGDLDLLPSGFIKTNSYLQTSHPDVFAIGDATVTNYLPTGTEVNLPLSTGARRQAHFAVKNLCGPVAPFPGMSGASALTAGDYKFATIGLSEKLAEKMQITVETQFVEAENLMPIFSEGREKIYFKLIYDPNTQVVLGGQILSKADVTANINAIALAIQQKLTVADLAYADFFFQPDFNQPWNIINVAAQAVLEK